MGEDVGRAATGIAYMQEALQLLEKAYVDEVDPRKKSFRGLSLAQNLLEVGKQHHQQQDAREALELYGRAHDLVMDFLRVYDPSVAAFGAELGLATAANSEDGANHGADAAAPAAASPGPTESLADGGGPRAPSSSPGELTDAARKAIAYARFTLSEICCGLGVAHNDVGQPDEALANLQKALQLRRDTVGKSHPSVAECLNNLGAVYFGRGALQKATEFYEQALDLLVEANGGIEEGAYVALTLYNIGLCRVGLGHGREAGAALRRALRQAENALGTEHRQVELIRETIQQLQKPSSGTAPPESSAAGSPSPGGGPS